MLNNFTLIIPTHERHSFLERLLNYYNNEKIEFKIIIIDSSKEVFKNMPDSKNFIYEHCPHMLYMEKINFALQKIDTVFSALCADDDFMIPSGINKCCEFLHNHKDYVSVQGRVVRFENLDTLLYFPDEYNSKNIEHEKCVDRAIYGVVTNYTQTFYSVFKTKQLKDIFSHATSINYSLIELFVTISSHLFGKHKVLPYFYYVRENHLNSSGKEWVGVEQIVVYQNKKYQNDYSFFLETFNTMLVNYKDNCSINAKVFIDDLIKKYLLNFDKNIFSNKKELKFISIIKDILRPIYVNIIVKRKNNELDKKEKRKKVNQLIEQTKTIKGYPFYDDVAKKELKKIEYFIKKYNIGKN